MNRPRRFLRMLKKIIRKRKAKTLPLFEVEAQPGCILKCDLGMLLEHTGIYIGKGRIVSLNRYGHIRIETPQTFFPPGTNPKSNKIYTACYGSTDEVLAAKHVVKHARKKIDDHTKYNVLFNNCHRFTAGCIIGNYHNEVMSFAQLEEIILLYIEELRQSKPWWVRLKNFIFRKKEEIKPSSFNWRAVDFSDFTEE